MLLSFACDAPFSGISLIVSLFNNDDTMLSALLTDTNNKVAVMP